VTLPFSSAHAQQTLQQRYLDIYLKINDAEHLEKQGDFRGALNDFQDCYNSLAQIHDSDPNWETALVVHRMDDCKAKILDLEPKAAAQPPPAPPAPPGSETTPTVENPNPTPTVEPGPSADTTNADAVAALKLQLQAVQDELRLTKEKLADSLAQLETYRTQLETVNQQLAAVKSQQSEDDKMGKLLSDNKTLTDKLAATQKELDDYKNNPKSKLALAQAQLKNLQDQYDESQEANKALQDTTTTLKTQLDQAQADLVAANQKLAEAGPGSADYETLKRENEVMRDILTRELQEQAHRDMAKRLAQEEFDNLKLKSKVLQEQLDILGSPMTPPTNDQEKQLLISLKVPGPDVSQPVGDTGFSANVTGNQTPADPAVTNTTSDVAPAPTAPDTNTASATVPATNTVADTTPLDNSTNTPPVNIVMNDQTPSTSSTTAAPDPSTTNAPTSTTPTTPSSAPTDPSTQPSTPAPTNVPDANTPIPPNGQAAAIPATTTTDGTSTTPAAPPTPPAPTTPATTTTNVPAGTTTYTDTTIQNGGNTPTQNDPTEYSTKARLPDDMRETAQDAADLFKNQQYDQSAAKYQSIIDKYPESLYAWSNLGVVRFQQGKFDEALRALQQAVKLSPTDAFSYSNLGIVYYQLNQYENAIDALNSAKALDPSDPKTHNYLGCACSQKGWQEVAEKEFRKAIELDPNFGDAHFNLALVYATSKPPSLELARREYNRALELGIAKDDRLEKLLQGTQQ
jgi:tetratricopeptide (TPR) repeat protein